MVGFGLTLEFRSSPPNRYLQCLVSRQPITKQLMNEEIQHLLDIRAIEPVPRDQERTGFYSILFLVPKSSGVWRGILNLKQLNHFILYKRFKMQSLKSILGYIREGNLLQSVDLKEA